MSLHTRRWIGRQDIMRNALYKLLLRVLICHVYRNVCAWDISSDQSLFASQVIPYIYITNNNLILS